MSNGDAILEQELTPAPLPFQGEQFSPSPFHYRFTGEDFLEIASYNAKSGVRVAVQGRAWDPVEGIRPFAFEHVPDTDRSRRIEVFGLARGYLLNLVVFASAGAPMIGQTFVSVHVIRGQGAARYLLATLAQGYVTGEQELGFPGSPIRNSIESGGYIRVIVGTNPAAGTEITETVPAGVRWQLLSLQVALVTDATNTNRRPALFFDNGVDNYGYTVVAQAIEQSKTASISFTAGIAHIGNASGDLWPCSIATNVELLAGHRIRTVTTALQAGDNYGAPAFAVREWLEAQS